MVFHFIFLYWQLFYSEGEGKLSEGKLICNMICISEIRGSRAIPVQMTFTYGWTLDEGDDPTLIDLHPCYFVEDNCTGSLSRYCLICYEFFSNFNYIKLF